VDFFQSVSALSENANSIWSVVFATAILFFSLFIVRLFFSKLHQLVASLAITENGLYFRSWEIIHPEAVQKTVDNALNLVQKVVNGLFIVIYLLYTLSFFELTKKFSTTLITLVWNSIEQITLSFLGYLPKLIFILVAIFITKQVINLFRAFMKQVETGQIRLHMFPAEYAAPTRQLLTFSIIVFAMVIIAPYLPGSGSDAFKGVTVFLGILVSLGSTTAIANIVASFVIQYMRAFLVGDLVQIGSHTGTVVSINLFSTRIQNYSNEYISIPNGLVLTSAVTNYSRKKSSAVEVGISIGYDVPWRDVHNALLEAANKVDGVTETPEPFVLQKSLDDFYVSYRLYAYVEKAHDRPHVASRLNETIRDLFEQKGIEILSPAFSEIRAKTEVISAIENSQ